MSTRLGLRYVRQNLLIGSGLERAALYRLGMVSYPFLPVAEKWRWLGTLVRLATVIGANFSLYRVWRAEPAERYVGDALTLLDRRSADPDELRAFLAVHARRLGELDAQLPELYLAVALDPDPPAGLGAGVLRSLDRARRRLEELAGVAGPQPIARAELEALAAAEQRAFAQLRAVLACERASTRELGWLWARAALRGLGEPIEEPFWQPDALIVRAPDGRVAYEPLEHDLWRLINAPLTEPRTGPPRLLAEAEAGVSHQASVCVGALADAPEFPGAQAELLFAPLEALGFPVDAVLHARWVGNRHALAQVRKRIADVEHAYHEQTAAAHGPGLLAGEDRVLAREYEAVLEASAHPPMLYASITLTVAAPDPDGLERRVTALCDQYAPIRLHRPRGLQEQLFLDGLPAPGGGRVRDYLGQLTVEQFGALMPVGTQQLGDRRGIYLGVTGPGRPVRYDPTAPSRRSRASAVLLAGTLGSGKTVAAQAIAYAAQRRGSVIVDFDPKPDHGLDRIPQLQGKVRVLELTGDPAHRGALDPLAIGLPELREELACSYYLELLRDPPAAWDTQIQRAVRDLLRAGERGSLALIERLRAGEHPAAREAADALEVLADFGLARLGFGSGEQALPAWSTSAGVTTIRTPGLSLPDPRAARETYTRSERISVATLALVAAYALWLVAGDRTRHKLVLLDEAWFLLASTQGRSLIARLELLGRGLNATLLLATQRLAHVGELAELIGTYLIFGEESDAEAERALALLGLDPCDRALVARVRGYRQGRCLMRDLDGRVGELQVDLVDPALLAALDTTPRSASA